MKTKKTQKATLTWESPETVVYQRGLLWKINASIALFLCITLGVYFHALTFSIAIAAFAIAYYLVGRKPIRQVQNEISELGITLDRKFYPYAQIKRFWIIYEPPAVNALHLHIKGNVFTEIKVQLADQNPETIRRALTPYLTELPNQHESFSEILLRIIKI